MDDQTAIARWQSFDDEELGELHHALSTARPLTSANRRLLTEISTVAQVRDGEDLHVFEGGRR